jgi:hypothetical protein
MMVKGEYYVGDLCYVIRDKDWDEVCKLLFANRDDRNCSEGEFNLSDGRRFAILSTAWGDGRYYDEEGREYPVDSGSIGCILTKDIKPHPDGNIGAGNVISFPVDFRVKKKRGCLKFGHIEIDTDS